MNYQRRIFLIVHISKNIPIMNELEELNPIERYEKLVHMQLPKPKVGRCEVKNILDEIESQMGMHQLQLSPKRVEEEVKYQPPEIKNKRFDAGFLNTLKK